MKCPQIIRRALAGVLAGIIVATSVPQSAMAATVKSSQEVVDDDINTEESTNEEDVDIVSEEKRLEDSDDNEKNSKEETDETTSNEIEVDKKDGLKSYSKELEESENEDSEVVDSEEDDEKEFELVFPTGGLMEIEATEIPLEEEEIAIDIPEIIEEVEEDLGISTFSLADEDDIAFATVEEKIYDSQTYTDEWEKYSSYYAYNHMSPKKKLVWDALTVECLSAMCGEKRYKTYSDGTLYGVRCDSDTFNGKDDLSDLSEFMTVYRYSNPQFFFLRSGYSYSYTSTGKIVAIYPALYTNMTEGSARQSAISEFKAGIDEYESAIVHSDNVKEVVQSIHDTICDKVVYNKESTLAEYNNNTSTHIYEESEYTQSAYSVFVAQKEEYPRYSYKGQYATVCAGYTLSLELLANSAGIECIGVTGPGHAYDKICVDDIWYNIDATWGDQAEKGIYYGFYLKADMSDAYNPSIEPNHAKDACWDGLTPPCTHSSLIDTTHTINQKWYPPIVESPSECTDLPSLSGTIDGDKVKVSISVPSGADVYYTKGENETSTVIPASSYSKSDVYAPDSEGFLVEEGTVIKAIATKDGYWNSDIVTYEASCGYSLGSKAKAIYDEETKILTIKGTGIAERNDILDDILPDVDEVIVKEGVTGLGAGLLCIDGGNKPLRFESITLPSTIKTLAKDSIGSPKRLVLGGVTLSSAYTFPEINSTGDLDGYYWYEGLFDKYSSNTGLTMKAGRYYSGTYIGKTYVGLCCECYQPEKKVTDKEYKLCFIEDDFITIPELPSYSNGTSHRFDGWFYQEWDGEHYSEELTQIEEGDRIALAKLGIEKSGDCTTINGKWTTPFKVTFNGNGGTLVGESSINVYDNDKYGELPTATRIGYEFEGWYTAATGGEEVLDTSDLKSKTDHTLYAHWTPIEYTITFDANGGELSGVGSIKVNYDSTYYDKAPTATKSGYTFAGWYTAATGGTKVTSTTKCTGDATIYAHWTANKYTVTFNANGGSVATNSKQVTFDGTYGELPSPNRSGYGFDGWYTAKTGGDKITGETTVATATNHTLYAHWDASSYDVSFDACGGDLVGLDGYSTKSVKYDEAYGELPTATRTGYDFAGWYTSSNGGSTVTEATKVATATHHTLYAHWNNKKYNVSFDGNGVDITMPSVEVEYDKNYSVLSNAAKPQRTGYTFAGWYTASEGGAKVEATTKVTILADQTLYAHWTANSYTVTLNANGGKVTGATSVSVKYNATYGILPSASKTGYEFIGWYTATTGDDKIEDTTLVNRAENHTLYARWDTIKYNITLDSNGGSEVDGLELEYGAKYGTLAIPTREGYTFDAWYTALTGGTKASATTVCKGDATLYARWKANKCVLTYDVNGGNDIAKPTKDLLFDAAYGDMPVVSRKGYELVGWSSIKDDAGLTGEVTKDTVCKGTTTIYAQWKPVDCEITFNLNGGVAPDDFAEVIYKECGSTFAPEELVSPTREGYTFVGWYTANIGGTAIVAETADHANYENATKCSANMTLWARWNKVGLGVVELDDEADKTLKEAVEPSEGPKAGQIDEAEIPEGLWVAGVPESVDFTGKAITFDGLRVYWDKNTLLDSSKDYSVKYANNTKAGDATITITGKGNYVGTIVKKFKINPLSLGATDYDVNTNNSDGVVNDANLIAPGVALIGNGKVQKGTTTLSYKINGSYVTLKSGTDYTLYYPGTDKKYADYYDATAFANPGVYKVIVVGKGNYTGSAYFNEEITDKTDVNNKLVSKLTISGTTNVEATGAAVAPANIVVKDGKTELTEGVHYTLSYQNNVLPGKATVVVTGTEIPDANGVAYYGTKIATFNITGIAISKAAVSNIPKEKPFTNAEVELTNGSEYKLIYKANKNDEGETLVEGTDYTVTYKNNVKAGTATITFTGIKRFTGTLNKTYKIAAHVFETDELEFASVCAGDDIDIRTDVPGATGDVPAYIYQKGATKPAVVVTYKASNGASADVVLTEGVDYTVSYAKNTTVNEGGYDKKGKPLALPTVKITGKGNYSKTVEKPFVIVGSDLTNATMTASDIVYAKKANICKPTITLYDSNGTKLVAGTDYDNKNIVYTYVDTTYVTQIDSKKVESSVIREADESVDLAKDIIPAGTKIKVTVTGKGNYSSASTKSAVFRYVNTNISKVTVTIPDQMYTGGAIEPQMDDINVYVKNGKVTEYLGCEAYKIISYENNVNKGTAKLTIQGVGNYGGTKTVNFKIVAKSMNYQITYDSNNGYMQEEKPYAQNATGTMKVSSTATGAKLSNCSYKRNGYKFVGWATSKDGSGDVYNDSNKYIFTLGTINRFKTTVFGNSVTLYAQWEPLSYKITYNSVVVNKNGVTENANPAIYTVGDEIVLTDPVRTGYTFGGWFRDSKCTEAKRITKIERSDVGNLTIYPKWIKNL